ncbi:TPA: hypothetical protein DF272_01450 [Candidatus Falkowbacteria bacterium]|nr:hypothetical protein [Candidatus Falkowbacteria bacterium]
MYGAFQSAEEHMGIKNARWQPVAAESLQQRFVEFLERNRGNVGTVNRFMKCIATRDVAEFNRFMVENHHPEMQLQSLGDMQFAAGAVMDVLVKWLQIGDPVDICQFGHQGPTYPGVHLKKGVTVYSTAEDHGRCVVKIITQDPDVEVLLIKAKPGADDDMDGLTLTDRGRFIIGMVDRLPRSRTFSGVEFPMVMLDTEPDVNWLCGLSTVDDGGVPAWVAQARMHVRLRVNLEGARAEAAFEMVVLRGGGDFNPPYVIDGPFYFIMRYRGVDEPLLVAYCDVDSWKDPGSLA